MTFEQILYTVDNSIAWITLNRPARLNAWTEVMEREVRAAMQMADTDESVRVIVLTGAGRGFCSGADVQWMGEIFASAAGRPISEVVREHHDRNPVPPSPAARADFQSRYSYFPSLSKPVIGALNGPVAGLGFVISLYCDIRLASAEATFTTAFARRGLIAEYGIAWMLSRLCGHAAALDLLMSARLINADEALALRLVNRVIPHQNFATEVRAYAEGLAQTVSPRSLRVMKRQVYDALFQSLGEAINAADAEMYLSFDCDDFQEGVRHFLEKRSPRFTGK
ncbi:MAG TPA: enoyl-CoA hydratase [Bryobacteraceae bacterium]